MKTTFFCFLVLTAVTTMAQPSSWDSRGPGGGGALFFPSINPADHNEICLSCDMSEYFHSTDQGVSWEQYHFNEIQGGNYGQIVFTNNPLIRYGINNADNDFSGGSSPAKSTDGGLTWTDLAGNPDNSEQTYTIHADFDNPNRLIISYYGSIYYSSNGGTSFSNIHNAVSNGAGNLVGGVFWDGMNIYIGTNDGIIRSTNGGTSFSIMAAGGIPATERIMSFAGAKQGGTTRFFCLTGDQGSVYVGLPGYDYWGAAQGIYSLDLGNANWVDKTANLNLSNTDFPMYIGMAANNINTVYASGSNSSSFPTVYKSSNAGTSWTNTLITNNNQNAITGWQGYQGDRDWWYGECALGFTVAQNDPDVLVFTDFGFGHISTDGGSNWRQMYVQPVDQNPAGAPTPKGNSYHSAGIENTTCWQVFWADDQHMIACYSDIEGCRSTDGGATWSFDHNLDQNSTYRVVKHNTQNILYIATATTHDMYQSTRLTDAVVSAGDGNIKFSTDNGLTWNSLHDFNENVVWVATDPNNNNRLYAAIVESNANIGGIYRSDNIQNGAASTWTKLPNPPRNNGHPFNIVVLNDGKLLASYSGQRNAGGAFTQTSGVFLYDPVAGTWADRSHPQMMYWTKDVVVDPFDANQNTWYAGVYSHWGCGGCEYGGLYKTTDRGLNWVRQVDSYRVGSCTINPLNTNEMYFTTETEGLWFSANRNNANPVFTQVNSYAFRQPERVFFNPNNQTEIWVSSFGNGMKVGGNCTLELTINGEANVCLNEASVYSTDVYNNAVYQWTVTGGTIISGQGTNQIEVLWNNGTAGSVSVAVEQ
jgi:photosystem II stability/assembly factor-like uncharacterized protein